MKARNALIVGGGFSGMAAAIEMRKRGLDVDLVEIDPGWRSYGAGISLGPPTLRAFRTLGILDAFLARGAAADGVQAFTAHGHKIADIPTPRLAGPDVPGGGGVMRPVLSEILAEATRASGARVRLGSREPPIMNRPVHPSRSGSNRAGPKRDHDRDRAVDGWDHTQVRRLGSARATRIGGHPPVAYAPPCTSPLSAQTVLYGGLSGTMKRLIRFVLLIRVAVSAQSGLSGTMKRLN